MPFFCFAFSQSVNPDILNSILSFIILHLLFYPASNGFNSYFDKDEESIGGLENPPPVKKDLYYVSLLLDIIALGLSLLVNLEFAIMLFIIGWASKAYSHPSVRLKKFPILGLFTVSFFQGAFTYLMSYVAINDIKFKELVQPDILISSILCSLILLGSYPMTQIYQHGEDGRRGDKTFSLLLGVKGTFVWTAVVFFLTVLGFFYYFMKYYSLEISLSFVTFLLPTVIYFFYWFFKSLKDKQAVNYRSAMNLNKLSSLSFICFFVFLYFAR